MRNPIKRHTWMALVCAIFLLIFAATEAFAKDQKTTSRLTQKIVELPEQPIAPDFSFADTQGRTHTLSNYRGKVVVVNFWATWCAPCRKEMPSLQSLWEQLRDQNGIVLVVNYWGDSPKDVSEFFKAMTVDFPILLGNKEELTEQWPVRGLPTTYVIDPQGRLIYKVQGDIEWDNPAVVEKILALQSN